MQIWLIEKALDVDRIELSSSFTHLFNKSQGQAAADNVVKHTIKMLSVCHCTTLFQHFRSSIILTRCVFCFQRYDECEVIFRLLSNLATFRGFFLGGCLSSSVVFNLGVAIPIGVITNFFRGRERYLVFVRNPFVAESDVVNVFSGNDATEEEFIALKNDSTAEDAFMSLPAYWSAMVASYSKVASRAVQLLMTFSSTWLCEACFSALLGIKNKARNKLMAVRLNDRRTKKQSRTPKLNGSCRRWSTSVVTGFTNGLPYCSRLMRSIISLLLYSYF